MSSLDDIIDAHSNSPQSPSIKGTCKGCGEVGQLVLTPSLTQYQWNGVGENPNASFYVCETCSQEHVEMMKDRWNEYWSSVL